MKELLLDDHGSYPFVPGWKEPSGTSRDAAIKIEPTAETLREAAFSPAGLTADEIAALLGRSVLSIRPRVSELYAAKRIRKSAARRLNESGMSATVWVANETP